MKGARSAMHDLSCFSHNIMNTRYKLPRGSYFTWSWTNLKRHWKRKHLTERSISTRSFELYLEDLIIIIAY